MISFITDVTRTQRHENRICITHNVDGYTTRKTILGAVHEIGKAIAKIDAGEGQLLIDAKTAADAKACLVPNVIEERGTSYCFELEEVSCASEYDEETDEMNYAEGNFYFHIRFFVWKDADQEEKAEEQETAEKKEEEKEIYIMKTWTIKDADGNKIMTVEANTAAAAKHTARRNGFVGFCTAEEAEPTQAATIPGKTEYGKILSWKTVCDNIAADENANDRAAARDILGAISGNHARPESIYPDFPCTGEEVERAKKYARFLGEVCYREFRSIIAQ